MKSSYSFFFLTIFFLTASAFTSHVPPGSDAASQALLKKLDKVTGGWAALAALKDVEYHYDYHDLNKKAKDISVERYIFDGEVSWADYSRHEVNALPGTTGALRQCYMDGEAKMTLNGELVSTPEAIGGTAFLRSANYFWFTMIYKLNDPGTKHQYLGKETINGIEYDKISLRYDSGETNKAVNDEYLLYFNPKTHLVDLFYFSLPAMGVNQPVLRMELEYEKINGVYIATKRQGVYPNEKGEYALGGVYTSSKVKFNNGFTAADLAL